jgi:hypothetical protein
MFPEKNLPTRSLKYCQFTVTFLFYHSYPYGLPVGSMCKEKMLEETTFFVVLLGSIPLPFSVSLNWQTQREEKLTKVK